MGKKTPAEWKKEGEELKALLASAKKKDHQFALVYCKEGMRLEAHPLHSAEKLFKQAKSADGASTKGTLGILSVKGTEITFHCEGDDVPGGIETRFKQYLSLIQIKGYKAHFNLPSEGNGADGAAVADGPEPAADGGKPGPDGGEAPGDGEKKQGVPSKDKLAADLKHMTEVFKLSFKTMSDEDAKNIKAALKAVATAIATGDLVSAYNLMNKLSLLTGVTGDSPLEPIAFASKKSDKEAKAGGGAGKDDKRKAALQKEFDGLKADLRDAVAKAEGDDKKKLGELIKGFSQHLKDDKLDDAEKDLKALKDTLSEGGGILDDLADMAGKVKDKLEETAKEEFKEFVEDVKEGVEDVLHGVGDALGILSEEDEKRIETLKTLNVPEGRQMTLIKLGRDNPKTFESAVKALKSLEKTHKDIDVSPQGVANAITAAADAKIANDAAAKASRAATAEMQKKKKELDEARAKEEAEKQKVAAAQKALDDYKAGLPKDLSKMAEAERAKVEAKIQELSGALKTASDALKTASDAAKTAKTAHDAAAEDNKTKRQAWVDAWDSVKKTEAAETKLQEKKALLDALSFGPLSANAKKPMDDASVAKFVDAFAKDPKVAAAAVKLADQAEDPKLIAENVGMLCDKIADGFADKKGKKVQATTEELQTMAENALKNGARLGPDYFKGLKDYLDSGKQTEPDDCEPKGLKPGTPEYTKKLSLNRTGKMADALMDENGKIDPDSKGAKEAMEHMMFHPGSLKTPAPAMTDQMSKLMDDFRDKKRGPQMQAVLDGIKEPTQCRATHSLVAATIGKDGVDVDAKDIKKSVMSAMLTPMAQGPVGSCFSTGPARAVREQDPVLAMKGMTEIATKGVFTPAKGDPIPAVMGLPKGENPLMRSYEYSIATAGAELQDSRENTNLRNGLFNKKPGETSLADIEDIVGSDKWKNEIQGKVQEAIEDGLVFRYNAGPKVGDGSGDGSSTHGRFEVLDASTKKPILSDKQFQEVIGTIALKACGETKDSDKGKKILELVGKQAFLDTVMKAYNGDRGTKYAPWNMESGGFARTSTEALRGGDVKSKAWMAEGDGKPENEGKRTKAVLESFLKSTQGETAQMISLSTNGRKDEGANHAFNGLPNHPSLDKIKPPKSDEKIQEQLLKPGEEMAKTKLPADQTAAMYDEMVKDIVGGYLYEDRAAVAKALTGQRPSTSMTPGELKKHVNDLLDTFKKDKLKEDMEAWEKEEKKKLKVDALPEALVNERRAFLEKNISSKINNNVDKQLIKAFKPPEVVIADTNWGGDDKHTYFVIAPDPSSGELKMWRKDKFSGEMSPAGDNWINSTWRELEGVPPVGS